MRKPQAKARKPWQQFRIVGEDGSVPRWSPQCVEFPQHVSHVTHLHTAVHIVGCNALFPRLIYEQSDHRERGLNIIWLSTRSWKNGSRYGSVSFDFEWKKLLKGRRAYFLEVVHAYKQSATQILLTRREYDMPVYRPSRGDGPWWWSKKDKKHYWNYDTTLEFAIDEPLSMEDVDRVSFVKHHPTFCTGLTCNARGLEVDAAAGRFIAELASDRGSIDGAESIARLCPAIPGGFIKLGWVSIMNALKKPIHWGRGRNERWKRDISYSTAALRAVARNDVQGLITFASHFRSRVDLLRAFQKRIIAAFPTVTEKMLPLVPL